LYPPVKLHGAITHNTTVVIFTTLCAHAYEDFLKNLSISRGFESYPFSISWCSIETSLPSSCNLFISCYNFYRFDTILLTSFII
jgi:hypothetical protein